MKPVWFGIIGSTLLYSEPTLGLKITLCLPPDIAALPTGAEKSVAAWVRRVASPRQAETPLSAAAPRFKVGDEVQVAGPGWTPRLVEYRSLQWTYHLAGLTLAFAQQDLLPAPVVCAPDGTRCEWMRRMANRLTVFATNYPPTDAKLRELFPDGCPKCGGRLRKENA